jgi:DNA-binding winged helix-turn-helix (wHTH) protein
LTTPLDTLTKARLLRFGAFELDLEAERLLKNGRSVRLQPQPFRLLCLLAGQPSRIVTREDIRLALWSSDTFVDFEQGVNFAIKQVREALGEDADHPIYIQTVPKRGYKFVAPVEVVGPQPGEPPTKRTDLALHKLLWTHIAELRIGFSASLAVAAVAAFVFFVVLRK